MKNFTLYGLNRPGEEARYIGITGRALKNRLKEHSGNLGDRRGRWLAKAKRENIKIEIAPYCVGLSEGEACELERAVIAELRKLGLDLVNTHEGGNFPPVHFGNKHALGYKHTSAAKENMSVKRQGNKYALGVKHTPEWKAGSSERLLGNQHARGCKHTPEQNAGKSVREKLRRERERQSKVNTVNTN